MVISIGSRVTEKKSSSLSCSSSPQVTGKIVVFNFPWITYFDVIKYRKFGASQAVKYGAVGALVKSITPFSIDSPHTGQQKYETEAKIPVACITVEDASMMQRMQDKGTELLHPQLKYRDEGEQVFHSFHEVYHSE